MTEKECIDRWDLVDNAIHDLFLRLLPNNGFGRDIHAISKVRDCIQDVFVNDWHLMSEATFYLLYTEEEDMG